MQSLNSLGFMAFAALATLPAPCMMAQSVAEQSGGYVPQVYSPTPRLAPPQGPYGPPPETSLTGPKGRVVPVLDNSALMVNRPQSEYPSILQPKDFFGRAYNPQAGYYDPFNNSGRLDGRPVGPGDAAVIPEKIYKIDIGPFASPEIIIAEDVWVTLMVMRENEIVRPSAWLEGSKEILTVRKSAANESPYIYLQANANTTNLNAPIRTSLDVDVVDKQGRVFNYKFTVIVKPADSSDFYPTIQANMVNPSLPPVYGQGGSMYAPQAVASAAISSPAAALQGEGGTWSMSYSGLTTGYAPAPSSPIAGAPHVRKSVASGERLTRAELEYLFPLYIGMAKAYEEALAAHATGYSAKDILRFRPATVRDGQIIADAARIPAFRNPFDNQLYFAIWGYFIARYDAILYEISFRNTSGRDILWDYSLLRIIPGFEPSSQAIKITAASPEYSENTPDGEVNTIWVLVQGRGLEYTTPIRLAFPPQGLDSTVKPIIQIRPSAADRQQSLPNFTLSSIGQFAPR